MGRLTGCKTYDNVQFQNKKGRLVVSNEKLAFQWEDKEDEVLPGKNSHKSWKWPDLKEFKVGGDGKGHRKFRIVTNKGKDDTISFVLLEDDNVEKLKADLASRILGRGPSPPRSPRSAAKGPVVGEEQQQEEEKSSGSPSGGVTKAVTVPFKVLDSVLLKPGQQIVQDYVVSPATNNALAKTIDRAVVQPTKDNMQLASKKAAAYVKHSYSDDEMDNSRKRGDDYDDMMDRSYKNKRGDSEMSDNSKKRSMRHSLSFGGNNGGTRKEKPIGKNDFPKHLEKLQKQLQEVIKAAPPKDQKEMIFALGCWAQNIANEPMGPTTN